MNHFRLNIAHEGHTNHVMGIKTHSRVRVDFGESLVDFDQLLYDLQSEYNIGFLGLFKVEEGISLFIQRQDNSSTRMALGKVKKICSKLAEVVEVVPFDTYRGELVESFGQFRPRGAKIQRGVDVESIGSNNGPAVPEFVKPDTNKQTHRGLSKDEELLIVGGKAYACREIPLPSNKSTFCAVYGSSDGTWTVRFWVGPIESLGVKDKKCVTDDQKTALLERQNHLCQECACPVSIGSYSSADIDHIIPRHLGGKTVLENLQIICVPCHRTKTGLESKGVRRVFPSLELGPSDRSMYAVASVGPHDLKSGILDPLRYMREPVGIVKIG